FPTIKRGENNVRLPRRGFIGWTGVDGQAAAPMIDLTFVLRVLGPRWRRFRIEMELKLMSEFRYVEFEALVGDDTGAIEGVVEPEVGSQRMMSGGGDNTVFESVAGREAEDADGFDADVVVGGVVHNSRVGIVGDRARQNVGDATAGMRDA